MVSLDKLDCKLSDGISLVLYMLSQMKTSRKKAAVLAFSLDN